MTGIARLVAAGVETTGAESVIVSGVTAAVFAVVVRDVVVLAAAVFAAVVFAAVVFAALVFAAVLFAAVLFAAVVFAAVVLGAVVLVVRAAGVLGDALAVDAVASVDSAAAVVVGGFDSVAFGWGSATGWVCTTWLAAVFGRAAPVLEGRRGAVFRGALIVFSAVASGSSCSGGGGAELTQLTYQGGRNSACLRGKLPQIRPRKLLRGRSRVDNDIRHRLPLEGVAG
ncbi:MAG TPA: hypothetical protein VGO31_01560 [Microbacteriaceae bacterium]|nr:hypothetical protein [Microbacteriaceae bacterium]